MKRSPEAAIGDEGLEAQTKKIKRDCTQLEPRRQYLPVVSVSLFFVIFFADRDL